MSVKQECFVELNKADQQMLMGLETARAMAWQTNRTEFEAALTELINKLEAELT